MSCGIMLMEKIWTSTSMLNVSDITTTSKSEFYSFQLQVVAGGLLGLTTATAIHFITGSGHQA
ncbi:hypothetical protein KY284_020335 [Solanum tuberosum]|nr:hypothetical protein KY284_020335 [Solanum tuberosum]